MRTNILEKISFLNKEINKNKIKSEKIKTDIEYINYRVNKNINDTYLSSQELEKSMQRLEFYVDKLILEIKKQDKLCSKI